MNVKTKKVLHSLSMSKHTMKNSYKINTISSFFDLPVSYVEKK